MRLDKLSWAAFVREAEAKGSDLFEFLLARAAGELETDKASVLARLSAMLKVMEESVAYGLTGVPSNSGLTGGNAQKMAQAFPRKENERFMRLLGPLASDAVLYATAVTECNAAMGRICAAPTAGASGIVVSNHGGRVLDQCPATAEVLPAIVDAVGGKMTILVDGGIRTGMDVFKALALGADAVLIGRPFVNMVYGGGAEGVQVYVDKLKAELADTMAMCGAHKLSDIKRSMLFGY